MTQIGESISIPEFISSAKHNKKTCPWHTEEGASTAQPMDPQAPDEDTDSMPKNLGTKLGENLGSKDDDEIWITYEAGSTFRYEVSVKGKKKRKVVQSYKEDEEYEYCYVLKYAPHHLIPGNESLKGSNVVPFLGDNNVIKHFKKSSASKIKDGKTVDYDVNRAKNGVWLPSPYALSMSNKWPSLDGIGKIKKRRKGKEIAEETEQFKHAYVAAAIHEAGNHQFHMRHVDYSNEVRKILDAVGAKLKLMAGGDCPIAASSKKNKKFDPPMGLKGRLDMLSGNLKRLLTGKIWRAPMYTDDKLMQKYVQSLKKRVGAKGKIDKVL